MAVTLKSAGGGGVTLDVPSTASNFAVTVPASTTSLVGTDTTQTLTNKTLGSGTVLSTSTTFSGTAQPTNTGTFKEFTNIPSWAKRVTLIFNEVSTVGNTRPMIRLGDSGGIETTGYNTSGLMLDVSRNTNTTGFALETASASQLITGSIVFNNITGNSWVATGAFMSNHGGTYYDLRNIGSKTLSGTLDRIQLTTESGTDTFDGGTINIFYE